MSYLGENDKEVNCNTIADCKKFKIVDYCVIAGEEGIKREIIKNGPVASVMPVYRDFLIYKEGIYNVYDSSKSKFNSL